MAELIKMPFGLRTRGPREPCVKWGPGAPWEEAILRGKGRPIVKYRDTTGICAKTAEPIEMPFGLWTWMGPRNHALDGVQIPPWEGEVLEERGAHCKV